MEVKTNILLSTVGKRGYIADWLREEIAEGSIIVGTGNDRLTEGFAACDEAIVVPSINDDQYLQHVQQLVQTYSIDMILTFSDLDVLRLSSIRDQLESSGVACFFPNEHTAELYCDKYKAYKYMSDRNIANPLTTDSVESAHESIRYPMIVKPRRGSRADGVKVVHNQSELIDHWDKIPGPIAQEFLDGQLVNVEVCSDKNGKIMSASVWERVSHINGETQSARTVQNEKALELAVSILETVPVPGPVDIDIGFKDGVASLIEVNTRFGGGYPVSHLANANFPKAMVQSLKGIYPDKMDTYDKDVLVLKKLTPFVFDNTRPRKSELQ